MTYILPLTARDFTRALWKSATECPVVFPGGVGVVPWMVPGGRDIAQMCIRDRPICYLIQCFFIHRNASF